MSRLSLVLVLGALVAACNPVHKPTAGGTAVPSDSAQVCASHCAGMGLQLSAVVVIRSSVGCVCQPGSAAPGMSAAGGSAAAAGGAVIAALIATAKQQQSGAASTGHK